MKKNLFIATISFSLILLVGCAHKEVTTKAKVPIKGFTTNSTSHNMNGNRRNVIRNRSGGYGNYTNVDNVDRYSRSTINGGYKYDTSNNDSLFNNNITNIYFDVDQYIITPNKLSTIATNANILKKYIKSHYKVKIEGHCDATGTDEYNYALGLRRAKATREALISKGIRASSIRMVSMGESSPLCTTNYSGECYAKNRRVEFKVIR